MITNERLEYLIAWLTEAKDKNGVDAAPEGTNEDWAPDLADALQELLSRRRDASERRFAPKKE
jgi:hypothetical protein